MSRYFYAKPRKKDFRKPCAHITEFFLGAALTGILPAPKCMIYTNLACDGNMMTFPYLKEKIQLSGLLY